ncbi:hypothetical protein [Burkholderia cepacia]|uniref:hypothetical protein n=1 Tax=Burkholderia cepacia TaxID=292 RepID=UPI001CF31F4C|nr:hypothetical protein [Burkholderia cepacia]MCA8159996.1 hypothetical protein [Burkholderia cepacia]
MKWMNTARNANLRGGTLRASNRSAIRRTIQCLALCTIAFSEFAFSACELNSYGLGLGARLPATVSVTQDEIPLGRQFPNSTSAGDWVASVAGNTWNCQYDEYVITPVAKAIPNVTYKTSNGKVATVFETGIPGIGFVVEVQDYSAGAPPWHHL